MREAIETLESECGAFVRTNIFLLHFHFACCRYPPSCGTLLQPPFAAGTAVPTTKHRYRWRLCISVVRADVRTRSRKTILLTFLFFLLIFFFDGAVPHTFVAFCWNPLKSLFLLFDVVGCCHASTVEWNGMQRFLAPTKHLTLLLLFSLFCCLPIWSAHMWSIAIENAVTFSWKQQSRLGWRNL